MSVFLNDQYLMVTAPDHHAGFVFESNPAAQAANVLLSSAEQDRRGFVAKVSDFGLSRVLGGNKNHIKTQTFGTVTHMPPELLSKGMLGWVLSGFQSLGMCYKDIHLTNFKLQGMQARTQRCISAENELQQNCISTEV